ncbi:MAG: PIN domain-containing protein [Candidatus Altiarchaeota archaeon]|nr:PIN domain-containing protein [Candidatus Altiarchaeota archaeon]
MAYYNKRDQHHERAIEILTEVFNEKYGLIYTSDYILDESVTVAWMRTKSKDIAINLGERLLFSEINLIMVTRELVDKTWELYRKEKNPSFTDCSTAVLMKENAIEKIMTFDKGFNKFKGMKVIQ